MATKFEKDKQKVLHDKNQMILSGLLRDDDNKYCVDCDAKGNINWLHGLNRFVPNFVYLNF